MTLRPRLLPLILIAVPCASPAQLPAPVVSLARETLVIPLDPAAVRPTVTAMIKGKPYQFILDTGAGGSIIDAELAKALALDVVGRSRVASPGGAPVEVDIVNVGTIAIGDATLSNMAATALSLPVTSARHDGVLSYRAFAGLTMSFDLQRSTLTLSKGTLNKDGAGTMSYELDRNLIRLPATIGSRSLALDLDTGNPSNISLPRSLMDSLPLKRAAVPGPDVRLVSGPRKTWNAQLNGTVVVAGMQLLDPEVTFIDLDRANVGTAFIRQFVVSIDQAQRLIRLERKDTVGRSRMTAVIDSVSGVLRARYVDADTGNMIAERLEGSLRAGVFDTNTTMSGLASMLTQMLRSVNGDRHLSVRTPLPGAGPLPAAPQLGGVAAITGTTILPGNVGYVAFKQIPVPTPEVVAALAQTMERLAKADALIIDVRDDGGGAGNFNDYVWGYLTGRTDSVPTMRAQTRGGPVAQRWTRSVSGPGPRKGIPVFVLVNGHTGSAAEGLAFYLQQSGRARVVGERTAGAGHNVALFPLPEGMLASISIGRVWYPGNMKEWERVGVVPDDSVPSANALCAAHAASVNAIDAAKHRRVASFAPLRGC